MKAECDHAVDYLYQYIDRRADLVASAPHPVAFEALRPLHECL